MKLRPDTNEMTGPERAAERAGWTARACAHSGRVAWFNAQQRHTAAGQPTALAAALDEALAETLINRTPNHRVGGADGQ
ncbi:MAG: hypothetical protein QM601_06300 [Pseudoxanthomonas sp.]